jgi:hypothetical protein
MSELDQMVESVHHAATGAVWPEAEAIRARGRRRRQRGRITMITVVSLGLALLGIAAAVLPADGQPRPITAVATTPTTPSIWSGITPPTATLPTSTSTRAVILRQMGIAAAGVLQARFAAGSLWMLDKPALAGPDPGSSQPVLLVRFDPTTQRVLTRWPIMPYPLALAVTDHYVWVGGATGSGTHALWVGEVDQYDFTGRLVHTYPDHVVDAMASAAGDSVWVSETLYPSYTTTLALLHNGFHVTPAMLTTPSGANGFYGSSIAVCPDGIFASRTYLVGTRDMPYQVTVFSQLTSQTNWTRTATGNYRIQGCDPGGGVLAADDTIGLAVRILLSIHDGRADAVVQLPADAVTVGACDAGWWVGRLPGPAPVATSPVWFLDRGAANRSSTVTVPGDDVVTTLDGCTLWAMSNDRQHLGVWTVTEIALAGGS